MSVCAALLLLLVNLAAQPTAFAASLADHRLDTESLAPAARRSESGAAARSTLSGVPQAMLASSTSSASPSLSSSRSTALAYTESGAARAAAPSVSLRPASKLDDEPQLAAASRTQSEQPQPDGSVELLANYAVANEEFPYFEVNDAYFGVTEAHLHKLAAQDREYACCRKDVDLKAYPRTELKDDCHGFFVHLAAAIVAAWQLGYDSQDIVVLPVTAENIKVLSTAEVDASLPAISPAALIAALDVRTREESASDKRVHGVLFNVPAEPLSLASLNALYEYLELRTHFASSLGTLHLCGGLCSYAYFMTGESVYERRRKLDLYHVQKLVNRYNTDLYRAAQLPPQPVIFQGFPAATPRAFSAARLAAEEPLEDTMDAEPPYVRSQVEKRKSPLDGMSVLILLTNTVLFSVFFTYLASKISYFKR